MVFDDGQAVRREINGDVFVLSDSALPSKPRQFELADIQPRGLESYVGITAVVYNDTSERGTVTVQFTAHDSSGNKLHEGTDSVSDDPDAQAPISKYWEKNPDD